MIKSSSVQFTSDETRLSEAKFHIVAVPTPVNTDHTPDLTPVIGASEIVGRNLTKGSIVVYESTVYPGVTEDVYKRQTLRSIQWFTRVASLCLLTQSMILGTWIR